MPYALSTPRALTPSKPFSAIVTINSGKIGKPLKLFTSELDTLKGLILFAKEHKIASFRYREFEFNLVPEDPNKIELKRLSDELDYTKNLVQKLKLGSELKR